MRYRGLRAAALFSGGKDSTYALHWAFLKGFSVEVLVTLRPERSDSWMFHRPAVELTPLQAEALGLPLIVRGTSGEKNSELGDLEDALREAVDEYGVYGVVTGALLSDYQRMNINFVAHRLGLKVYSPLWRKNQASYMRDLVRHGFKFLLTSISAYGLPPRLLGRPLGEADVEEIIARAKRYGFNPAFEGGEAETLVVDAPLFRSILRVQGHVEKKGEFEYLYVVDDAWLEEKEVTGFGRPAAKEL